MIDIKKELNTFDSESIAELLETAYYIWAVREKKERDEILAKFPKIDPDIDFMAEFYIRFSNELYPMWAYLTDMYEAVDDKYKFNKMFEDFCVLYSNQK